MIDGSLVAVVGDPRRGSRTLIAASDLSRLLARRLGLGTPRIVDLAAFGPAVLDATHAHVAEAADVLRAARLAVVASPVHGGVHTELLRTFLQRLRGRRLARVTAVPVLVTSRHSFDHVGDILRPALIGLGATCAAPSLTLHEDDVGRVGTARLTISRWAEQHAGALDGSLRQHDRSVTGTPTDTGPASERRYAG